MYLQDSDKGFPAVNAWHQPLTPYLNKGQALDVEIRDEIVLSPAMNGLLDYAKLSKSPQPEGLVVIFEVLGPVPNAWGGPSSAWEGYGEGKKVAVGFADGHARLRPRVELFNMQWRP